MGSAPQQVMHWPGQGRLQPTGESRSESPRTQRQLWAGAGLGGVPGVCPAPQLPAGSPRSLEASRVFSSHLTDKETEAQERRALQGLR